MFGDHDGESGISNLPAGEPHRSVIPLSDRLLLTYSEREMNEQEREDDIEETREDQDQRQAEIDEEQ